MPIKESLHSIKAEIDRELNAMAAEVGAQHVEKVATLLHAQLISRVPRGPTGNLEKSIAVFPSKFEAVNHMPAWVVRVRAPHAHLVEYGHVIKRTKDGPEIGRVQPHPFVEPSLDATWAALDAQEWERHAPDPGAAALEEYEQSQAA